MCACGRGAPGWKPDPGVCPNDDEHGPAGGHCACCHEPGRDADRRLPVTGRDAVREQLAAALAGLLMSEASVPEAEAVLTASVVTPALLPTIDRIATERAAAAEQRGYERGRQETAEYLNRVWQEAHSAALRASNGQGAT